MLINSIGQGLLWTPLVLGVYITFRILDIPDLTTEGSFPLGAAVTISAQLSGQQVLIALLLGFLTGTIAGIITGILNTKLHIPALLAGILTLTGLYSINIHIMGRANLALIDQKTLIDLIPVIGSDDVRTIVVTLPIVCGVLGLLYIFFSTKLGLNLRAVGNNRIMSVTNGIRADRMTILGYAISNGLIALSGGLIAQGNGFADINMGVGTIVIGLASVLLGEIMVASRKIVWQLVSMAIGAIIYRTILAGAMNIGISPDDLKIFSALILVVVIVAPMIGEKLKQKYRLAAYLKQKK